MRACFTLVLNGVRHLKIRDHAEWAASNFDYWVIVEGACANKSKDSWYSEMPGEYHNNGRSIDGTIEYIMPFVEKHPNVHVIQTKEGLWSSKLAMSNAALDLLTELIGKPCWLWQMDADEHWNSEDLIAVEKLLGESEAGVSRHHMNTFVGEGLVAKGGWGEALDDPVRRCWKWNGVGRFKSHAPPLLEGCEKELLDTEHRFDHYSYYFEEDVQFKDRWYAGHQGIYANWLNLQKETQFPQPISALLVGRRASSSGEIVRLQES